MNDQVFCIRSQQDGRVYINEESLHAPDYVTVFLQLSGIKTIQQKSRWWLPRVILLRNGTRLCKHGIMDQNWAGIGPMPAQFWSIMAFLHNDREWQ